MRTLLAGINVDPASAEYQNGRTRDEAGAVPGTTTNEVLNGDAQQFFQKLIRDAGVVPNGTPDNTLNNFQLLEALVDKIQKTTLAQLGEIVKTKKIDIGAWDMTASTSPSSSIIHGLDSTKIIGYTVLILDNNGLGYDPVRYFDPLQNVYTGAGEAYNATEFNIRTVQGNTFWDDVKFNGAGNRGYITVFYLP